MKFQALFYVNSLLLFESEITIDKKNFYYIYNLLYICFLIISDIETSNLYRIQIKEYMVLSS